MSSSSSPRRATDGDVPAIRSVVAAAYEKYLERMDRPPAPLERDYTDVIRAGSVWVAGDPVVAVISLTPTDNGALLVENVAVHPSAQGAGLGRLLMEFVEEHAARLKLERVTLYTNEAMTENVAIYEHLGYVVTGRATQDGYRRVFMVKSLRLV